MRLAFAIGLYVSWLVVGATEAPFLSLHGRHLAVSNNTGFLEASAKLNDALVTTQVSSSECSPGGAPTVRRFRRGDQDVLRYCGVINSAGVEAVEAQTAESVSTLVITSFGGSLDAPIRLAEIVAARALNVEVVGPCLSGCASFVFVAGKRRVISSTGVLGFHNTATSAGLIGLHVLGDDVTKGLAPVFARASREWRLYARKGVSFSLLYEPQARIDTLCIRLSHTHQESGERIINIYSRHDFWLPTLTTLRQAGLDFEGSLPANEREAIGRFSSFMPANSHTPKFIADNKRYMGSAELELYKIRVC